MIKDKLLERANATPDDAKAAIVITVLADGSHAISASGLTTPGVFKLLGAAVATLGGELKPVAGSIA